MAPGSDRRQPVVVVTGGGGGIGRAVAEELGRRGWYVVTADPLVSVDGSQRVDAPEEATTADRIVSAGGTARATAVSVTDGGAVRELFQDLVGELGGVDAVVNVAGITRPTGFASGDEADWHDVLDVHLGGYLNVLRAALPAMADAGHGRILGVTSGSGWRAADAGAYACAKRAVAAVTWQLGRCAPPGVTVNAISPIAVTRMVTAALARQAPSGAGGGGAPRATGGLSLGAMPEPEQLAPLVAHLVESDVGWCNGRVVFAGGTEVAVVDPPRFLEVVRTDRAPSLAGLLDAVVPAALAPAEQRQASGGGGNPRFVDAFRSADAPMAAEGRTCVVVGDQPDLVAALDARSVRHTSAPADGDPGVALAAAAEQLGAVDAVVVAPEAGGSPSSAPGWAAVLEQHDGVAAGIEHDAAWARAVAGHAAAAGRPVALAVLTDASTTGGASRAQAFAQLARAARRATEERVAAFAVAVEDPVGRAPAAALVARLVADPEAHALSGAELATGDGWVGLRSHPRPAGSIALDQPDLPPWFDAVLREVLT